MLSDLVAGRRATTIGEAADIMTALDGQLSDTDGVKWFNRLYLHVTLAVRDEVSTTTFRDPEFLGTLDVLFANLYFDAVAAGCTNPASAPSAWRPLFECRGRRGIRPLQFALAGMNAHINNDLVIALDRLAHSEEHYPTRGSERHRDFRRVNDVLERVEAELRPVLSTGVINAIDVALGDLDTVLAMWKVSNARETAWTNGEVVWHLRVAPHLRRDYLSRLDRMVGFAGRGLLAPAAEVAKRNNTRMPWQPA